MKFYLPFALIIGLFMVDVTNCIAQNNALSFDGTDDYVSIPHTPSLLIGSNPLTLEFWFKAPNVAQFGTFILKRQPSNPYPNVGAFINDGTDPRFIPIAGKKITFSFGYASGGGDFRAVTTTNDVVDGQYHHVACVVDPSLSSLFLYIDGVLAPVNTISTGGFPTFPITNRFVLGQNNGSASFYTGLLDDVRIWDIARTQTQIQASMNTELAGTELGLVSYYKFDDQASLCDITDCNANENHGTRVGPVGLNNLPQYSTDIPSLSDVTCGANINCSVAAVPTLSEWGLIFLTLLMLIFGALAIRRRQVSVPV